MIGALLGGLETVFGWLLEASWQASVLVLLVLLLQVALRGRLNPRWYHALWLLVIARLLLPFLPESALSLFQFAPTPPPIVTETVKEPIFNAPTTPIVVGLTMPHAAATVYPFSVFTVLALIWLTGAVGLFILTWQVNRRFTRHVGAASPVTDPNLLMLAEAAQQEFGLHRRLRIIESAQVQSPAIMGLFRPTLILPKDVRARFADPELRFIFLHEFAHLKRGDLFLQWLIALLQILHWFNPVLWYAFRRMRVDREPATDALVLSRTGEEQKEPYGQVLVKLLEHYHQRHSLPTLVGILEDKDQFKRRFSLIARFTRGAYGWSLLGVVVLALLAVVCLTKAKAQDEPSKAEKYLELVFVEEPGAINGSGSGPGSAEEVAQLLNSPKNKVTVMSDVALKNGSISLKVQTPAGFSVAITGDWKIAIKTPQKIDFRIDGGPAPTANGAMMATSWESKDDLSEDAPLLIFQPWKPESHANLIIRIVDHPTATKSIGYYPFSRTGEVPPSVSASDADAMKTLKLSNWRVDDIPMNDFLPALSKRLKEEDGADVSFVLMVPAEGSPYPVTFHIPTGTNLASLLDLLNKRFPIRYKYRGPGDIVIWQVSHFETAFDQKAEDTKIDLDLDNVAPADALRKIQEASAKAGFAFYDGNLDPYHRLQPTPMITMHGRRMTLVEAFHQFMLATNTRLKYDGERFCLSPVVGDLPLTAGQTVDSNSPGDSDGQSPGASVDPKAASTSDTLAQLVLALRDSAKAMPADHQRLQVLKGFYGSDGSWRDVTGILQKSVHNNSLKVSWQQPYTEIGGDPAYLQVKTLVVSYRLDGVEKLATFREENPPVGLQATIPPTPASTSNAPTSTAPVIMTEDEAQEKGIVAFVNGKPIYWADITYNRSPPGDTPNPKYTAQELRSWAQDAIEDELIVQANDTSKDPFVPDIQQIIAFGVKGFGGDKNAFAENLRKNGTTLERFTEMNRKQGIVNHVLTKFYADHRYSMSTSSLTEEEKKKQAANGYTDMMRQKDEWLRGMYAKATIQLFTIPESLILTSTASDTGQSQAQTWLQVDYCETTDSSAQPTSAILTTEQAHSKIFNPTNKIASPKLVYFPLTIGTNTFSFKKPSDMKWTVTVDWKDPQTTNTQAVTVKAEWPHANGGDVSYGAQFPAMLQPNACFWVVGPWKGKASSNIFVHFVDAPSGQPPKAAPQSGDATTVQPSSTRSPVKAEAALVANEAAFIKHWNGTIQAWQIRLSKFRRLRPTPKCFWPFRRAMRPL